MNPTDAETLRGLARLARLELPEEELRAFAPELERILQAFAVLERHAAPRPPDADPAPAALLRPDVPAPSAAREALLEAAPAREDGFFVVPKTVGGEP